MTSVDAVLRSGPDLSPDADMRLSYTNVYMYA